MNDNTQKASANIQAEFTLDELSKEDWFEDNIEESICILLSNNDPVLTEYVKEKRVIPNLEQIKQLCPEFYDSAIILGTYDGTRVTFELGEIMSNDNQSDLDSLDDLLDCFDGETVEGGVSSQKPHYSEIQKERTYYYDDRDCGSSEQDFATRKIRLLRLSIENAIAHAKALIKLTGGKL